MNYSKEIFSHRLWLCRQNACLKQDELAALSGISQRAIAKFESGEQTPRLDKALRLANALNTTLNVLTGIEPLVFDDELDERRQDANRNGNVCEAFADVQG